MACAEVAPPAPPDAEQWLAEHVTAEAGADDARFTERLVGRLVKAAQVAGVLCDSQAAEKVVVGSPEEANGVQAVPGQADAGG
jgi:hypothetical protein